jgi:hypothetical protein
MAEFWLKGCKVNDRYYFQVKERNMSSPFPSYWDITMIVFICAHEINILEIAKQ